MLFIASDHAGFELKNELIRLFQENNIYTAPVDLGTDGLASCDYPDYAHALAAHVVNDVNSKGILICGSGVGVCIAANRHAGVRAALCWQLQIAVLARQHNDANVLCLPSRFVGETAAWEIVRAFLDTNFEGGRHQQRIDKIDFG
jgi:ribose 5-phosphate isomerase B